MAYGFHEGQVLDDDCWLRCVFRFSIDPASCGLLRHSDRKAYYESLMAFTIKYTHQLCDDTTKN